MVQIGHILREEGDRDRDKELETERQREVREVKRWTGRRVNSDQEHCGLHDLHFADTRADNGIQNLHQREGR
jgi:hypothetical protein